MDNDFIIEYFNPVEIVTEMATGNVMVPLPDSVVEAIRQDDDDPVFATFCIEEGWSKSKRLWGAPVFESVQEQINNPGDEPIVGYLGHISPEKDAYDFPDIQFQWLKARIARFGDKARIFTKAYVLPDTKARYYLKKKLARTVSWRGEAVHVPIQGGVEMKNFIMESIDLARPRKAGMSAKLVALTSEMEEGGTEVKPEEIAALQENELRAHNSGLVTKIEDGAKQPLTAQVSEMEEAEKKTKPVIDLIPELRKLLGLGDETDDLSVLQAAISNLRQSGKKLRDSVLDTVLAKRLKGDEADVALARRLIASEIATRDPQMTGDEKADEALVTEMVNSLVDGDDTLKKIVSEMEEQPPRIPEGTGSRSSGRSELKVGYSDSRIRVRSAN